MVAPRHGPTLVSPEDGKPIRTHIDAINYDIVNDGVVIRLVDGSPRYRVGDNGTIWSARKFPQESLAAYRCWKQITPGRHTGGYLQAHFYADSVRTPKFVHRLVLEAFVGPCPDGMEACHNDGNRANNRLENLRWDTRVNNHADKAKHGTLLRGRAVHGSKLHELVIPAIRSLGDTGVEQWKIAEAFGVTESLVAGIIRREIWKHVSQDETCLDSGEIRRALAEFSNN